LALRVHSEEGAAPASAPSIIMPRASTELTELLAGDDLLCVRRRETAPAPRPIPTAEAAADADLASLIEAWPNLPRGVRAAILAMIRETMRTDA